MAGVCNVLLFISIRLVSKLKLIIQVTVGVNGFSKSMNLIAFDVGPS